MKEWGRLRMEMTMLKEVSEGGSRGVGDNERQQEKMGKNGKKWETTRDNRMQWEAS